MSESNRLPILAAEIRRAHADVQEAAKTAAEHAITAGHALIEAKALVKHGQWLPWLREHCALAERTAQLYMKIARSGLESATVADLGLKFAADCLIVHLADPWDAQPEDAVREWLVWILFGVSTGWRLEGLERHAHWLQRNGFASPDMWIGDEGEEYRARYKRISFSKNYSAEYKRSWAAFQEEHSGRSIEALDAELQVIAAAEPPLPEPEPARRRPRRRAA